MPIPAPSRSAIDTARLSTTRRLNMKAPRWWFGDSDECPSPMGRNGGDTGDFLGSPAAVRESQRAEHILETKAGHFDAGKFEDRYETAVVEMLTRKQAGLPPEQQPEAAPPTN